MGGGFEVAAVWEEIHVRNEVFYGAEIRDFQGFWGAKALRRDRA